MTTDPLMPKRNTGRWFTIDANRINARQLDKEMNLLERWHEDGVIDIIISEPASNEALKAGSPDRFKKARRYFHSQTLATTSAEREQLRLISYALLGRDVRNNNEVYDVEILFNTKKYPGGLITEDGLSKRQPVGILGRKAELAALGIQIYRTSEAIDLVRKCIRIRDMRATQLARKSGEPIAEWVGKD